MTTDTQTLTSEQEYAIDKAADILAPIFEANDWKYGWGPQFVPDGAYLAQTIQELVETLTEDESTVQVSSGRITVIREWNDDTHTSYDVEIKLDVGKFTVEPPEESVLGKIRRIAEAAKQLGYDSPELVEIRRLIAEVS